MMGIGRDGSDRLDFVVLVGAASGFLVLGFLVLGFVVLDAAVLCGGRRRAGCAKEVERLALLVAIVSSRQVTLVRAASVLEALALSVGFVIPNRFNGEESALGFTYFFLLRCFG